MFSDGAMDAEDYGFELAGQVRDAEGPLAAFDMSFRNVNDITHGLLLTERHPVKFHRSSLYLC